MDRDRLIQRIEFKDGTCTYELTDEKAKEFIMNEKRGIRLVFEKLYHYEYLAEQGRLVEGQYKAGDWVYVVERDEDGEACEVSGYIFIASCRNAVIVSPRINGSDDVSDILERQIAETIMQYNGDLAVFPKNDCYDTLEKARAQLISENKRACKKGR